MANLIDFNIKQLTIMIACVHIMDVVIFQNIIAGIYLLLRRLCILCLLSRIGGRGKGGKYTCCLECIHFTTFGFYKVHTLLQSQKLSVCPNEGASCVTFTNKTDIILYSEYL